MTGLLSRKRTWIYLAVAIVACAVASTFVLTARSSADADQPALNSVISGFQQAEASQADIPADSVHVIEAKLAELKGTSDGSAGDTGSPVQILPASVCEQIDQADAARLQTYCSVAYQKRHVDDEKLSDIVQAGLYNNPQDPLVVHGQTKLLAGAVMKNDGTAAIVWAYSWWGDVTAKGNGGQSWDVVEYRMVKEGVQWKVDARSPLVSAESTSKTDEWGPSTPHTSIVTAEQEGPSAIYPGQAVPQDQLAALADMAASAK